LSAALNSACGDKGIFKPANLGMLVSAADADNVETGITSIIKPLAQ